MKRTLCALLALCLLLGGLPALALTGEEALGLARVESSGDGEISTYPLLQKGSKDGDDAGAYVVILQNRLAELGYMASAADGTYGTLTESAVINFQETNGLTPTGIADSATQSMLYSSSAQRAVNQNIANNDTVRVQQMLTLYGFMAGLQDGVAGETTQNGVAEFKEYIRTNPIYADYVEPEEEIATDANAQPVAIDVPIDSVVNENGQTGEITETVLKFADGEYPFQTYQMTVQKGATGSEVRRVQRRLRQLKYLYNTDGEFGSLTERALKYFQRKHGLPETGVADEATQRLLFSNDAQQSEEYVFPYKIAVSLSEQKVYVFEWDGSGYNTQFGSCTCSTGQEGYETPKGVYQSGGRITSDEWYYFQEYNCYAKYATRIVGGVLFHSVLYNANKEGPTKSSVRSLGQPVSHGCVRLPEEAAKWIYDNCAYGTTVVVY